MSCTVPKCSKMLMSFCLVHWNSCWDIASRLISKNRRIRTDHQGLHCIALKNQMLGTKHAFSGCYVCEVMHAMSTSTVHPLNTINNNTALIFMGLFTADVTMPNHIPKTFRSQAGWIFYCPYLQQCIMYWVETWHRWWGGYYKADHNTLYFSARNFLMKGQRD